MLLLLLLAAARCCCCCPGYVVFVAGRKGVLATQATCASLLTCVLVRERREEGGEGRRVGMSHRSFLAPGDEAMMPSMALCIHVPDVVGSRVRMHRPACAGYVRSASSVHDFGTVWRPAGFPRRTTRRKGAAMPPRPNWKGIVSNVDKILGPAPLPPLM